MNATNATFTPNSNDLYMNSGDHVSVAFADTSNGLKVTLNDLTTGQSGSMVASKPTASGKLSSTPTGSQL